MTILLTGGTGKTSTRIAGLLTDAKISFLLTSRQSESTPTGLHVYFDWTDSSTYANPFKSEERITAIYLIAPTIMDPFKPMNEFVELAFKKHGVKRFVLMGGIDGPGEGRHVGKVWQKLLDLGVEYCVLRPAWFMDNLSEPYFGQFLPVIKDERKIYTAAGEHKIPFISAKDVARVAFHGLVDEKSHDTDHKICGAESLTYDEIAEKLTRHLEIKIEHVKLGEEERAKQMVEHGTPEPLARFLANIEATGAGLGELENVNDFEKVTGDHPQSFDKFVEEHKTVWL
ncbi:hypothetical protein PQX77_011723 [Marasmius sp. AFHP31]|nr:hypothetical protein PQX77_011723 [Marasmius sp. AFHP31]